MSFPVWRPPKLWRNTEPQSCAFMLTQMEEGKDISRITYQESDPNGQAARAFYKRLGFSESRLTEEFGHPAQEFVLKRQTTGQT